MKSQGAESRVERHAHLKQELDKALVQLNEEVGLAGQLRQAAGLERRSTAAAAHAPCEPGAAAEKTTRTAVDGSRRIKGRLAGRRRRHFGRSLATAGAASGERVSHAFGLGFHHLLNPSSEVAEGVGDDGKRLHGESLLVCAESQKSVDALVATGVDIRDTEDVSCGIPGKSIAKENRSSGASRAGALGGDKGGCVVGLR